MTAVAAGSAQCEEFQPNLLPYHAAHSPAALSKSSCSSRGARYEGIRAAHGRGTALPQPQQHATQANLQPVAAAKAHAAGKGERDASKRAAERAAAAAARLAAAGSGGGSSGRRPGRLIGNRGTWQGDLQGLHAAGCAGRLASKRPSLSEWTRLETHGARLVCRLGTCGCCWSAPIRPPRAGWLQHGAC